MSEHVNGTTRDQTVLFPDTIDKYVAKENPVRVIDAFVESLNLEKTRVQTPIPWKSSNLPAPAMLKSCGS